jgi:flagellar hook-basal body complex protein FliE
MSDMKITGAVSGEGLASLKPAGTGTGSPKAFEAVMEEALGKLSQVQKDSDQAVKELASGGDVTHAAVSMEKAEMNFQLMIEVRNKLLSAYEEIMRMQV